MLTPEYKEAAKGGEGSLATKFTPTVRHFVEDFCRHESMGASTYYGSKENTNE
jgi:hypothetical protein